MQAVEQYSKNTPELSTRERINQLESEIRSLRFKTIEQNRPKEALPQAQKMEALGLLAGGIIHDLNNILQIILGFTHPALKAKAKNDPDYEVYSGIESTVKKGRKLIKQFLRLDSKQAPTCSPVNLNDIIKGLIKFLSKMSSRRIDIELDLSEDLKMIDADKGQIEQIIMNLFLNARDAMTDRGKLTFRTENVFYAHSGSPIHSNYPTGEYVLLTATDTGHGMATKIREKAFEPFFTSKKNGKGSGLGLSVIYAIVNSNGGFIDCSSRVGKGTTFTIHFPALKPENERKDQKTKKERTANTGANETILLVDDEPGLLDIGKQFLQKHGYRIITAKDGEEAVRNYRAHPVDLVVLDIGLPGMGGIQCLKALMSINQDIKIIISSGYASDDDKDEALKLGASYYLPKPYTMQELLNVTRSILAGSTP